MTDIILSSAGQSEITLSEGSGRRHDVLKNLAFEESGHTGFQAELTKEQLSAIESVAEKVDKQAGMGLSANDFTDALKTKLEKAVTNEEFADVLQKIEGKENLSNKVVAISENSTDEQYPSAKATWDYVKGEIRDTGETIAAHGLQLEDMKSRVSNNEQRLSSAETALEGCGDFELVDSAELTENVMQLIPTINGQYKELYLRFTVPASGNASSIKARWMLQMRNDYNNNINKTIYNLGNTFVSDYTAEWYTGIYMKVFGKFIRTEVWFETTHLANNGYARGQNSTNYSGFVAPSVPTVRGYIDALKVLFTSPSDTADEDLRYLPIGTEYELWGVKA